MTEKHYGETKTVLTKKELNEATKQQYGRICVTGDLLEDIKKEFKKKSGKADFGAVGFFVSAVLCLIPPLGAICSVTGLICGGMFLGNRKASKYYIRPDISNNPNELWLLHSKEVDKIRSQYDGIFNATALDLIQLSDMMFKNVKVIHVKRSILDEIINNVNSSKIIGKKVTISDFEKYKGYRIISEGDDYRFTKIE